MNDVVNHPQHYTQTRIECIEVVRCLAFSEGNAIKYIHRHRDKGKPIEDLRKALWYLNDAKNYPIVTKMLTKVDFPSLGQEYLTVLTEMGFPPDLVRAVEEILFGDMDRAVVFINREIDRLSEAEES